MRLLNRAITFRHGKKQSTEFGDEQNLACIERILKEIRMESTMSTEDLKGRLDRNESIKVVETLAPERYREAHLPGAVNIPRRRDANSKVAERAISPFLTKSVS